MSSTRIVLANEITSNGETSYEVISEVSHFFNQRDEMRREIERLTALVNSSEATEVVEEEKPKKSPKKSKSKSSSKVSTAKKSAKKSVVTDEDRLKKLEQKLAKTFKSYNHNVVTESLLEEKMFSIECTEGSFESSEECLEAIEALIKKALNRSGLKMKDELKVEEDEGFVVLCEVEFTKSTKKKTATKKTPTKKKTAKKSKTPTEKKEKTTKKTTAKKERKSPEESAKEFEEGHEMEGKDGNTWVVKANKNGVKRWAKKSTGSKKKTAKKEKTTKKKTAKKEKKSKKKSAKKPKKVKTPEPEKEATPEATQEVEQEPEETTSQLLREDGDYKEMDEMSKRIQKVLMKYTKQEWEIDYDDNHNGVMGFTTGEDIEKTASYIEKLITKIMVKSNNKEKEEFEVSAQQTNPGLSVDVRLVNWE